MRKEMRRTLCYKLFNKPGNLIEALDKAKKNGNSVEIRIWSYNTDAVDFHCGKIKSPGFTSLYFTPFGMAGQMEEYHQKVKSRALAAKRWFEKNGVYVTFVDNYKHSH